jgi:L-lactate dehydrogenase complex protein LldG
VEHALETAMSAAPSLSLWDRFVARAEAVGAIVQHASGEAAAASLIAQRATAPACTTALAGRFPSLGARYVPLDPADPPAPDVVALGRFAVAETGSVLVLEANVDRRACLLAERLWLLVPSDEIVPSLDQAFQRLGALIQGGARYATFMTGPSRSADIERTVTIGVHGPRELTVVVLAVDAA